MAEGILDKGVVGGFGNGAAAFPPPGAGAGGSGTEPAAPCAGAENAGLAWGFELCGVCAVASVGGQGGQFGSRGVAAAALGLERF
ncbi:MAG: hypothetical protein FWH34_06575, partial [Desulfovibrionaceae bacterium]|nr:hypothetical protein [Desulfovibrionaceae bacterium]